MCLLEEEGASRKGDLDRDVDEVDPLLEPELGNATEVPPPNGPRSLTGERCLRRFFFFFLLVLLRSRLGERPGVRERLPCWLGERDLLGTRAPEPLSGERLWPFAPGPPDPEARSEPIIGSVPPPRVWPLASPTGVTSTPWMPLGRSAPLDTVPSFPASFGAFLLLAPLGGTSSTPRLRSSKR